MKKKKVSTGKRVGRPRKDGQPARARAKALPMGVRRGIKKMLDDGKPLSHIKLRYERYHPTDDQIRHIKYGRVKLVKEPRKDSYESPTLTGKIRKSNDPIHLMREILLDTLNDLDGRPGYKPEDRSSMLNTLALVNKRIESAALVSELKRRDADVVLAIIRMYEPNATEDDAIKIYRQALELLQMDNG